MSSTTFGHYFNYIKNSKKLNTNGEVNNESGEKMKLFRYSLLVCLSLFFLSITALARDDGSLKEEDYLKKVDLIYLQMQDSLSTKEKLGDVNADFLNQMLNYQRGLIALSKNQLEYGEQNSIKKTVNEIAHELKTNINKINQTQKKIHQGLQYDETKEASYLSSYEGIYQQILITFKSEGAENPTLLRGGSVDEDYLDRLTQQCDVWAIFINNFLTQTEDEEVKALANELLESANHLKEQADQLLKKIETKKGD